MRAWAALAIAAMMQAEVGGPEQEEFRYRREVLLPAAVVGEQSCAVLDGALYAHAAPALRDVRLFGDEGAQPREIPYVLTVSETGFTSDRAAVLNLSGRGQEVTFDLAMPNRLYSGLVLQLGGKNFLVAAKVTGLKSLKDANGRALGTFTLFDLSGQRLGRNMTVALPESGFPFVHVELAFARAPGQGSFVASPGLVEGVEVPPSREAQTLYTTVATTDALIVRGRASVAAFTMPAHVPVERVSFVPAPGYTANFSRMVRITAMAEKAEGEETPASEEVTGQISRVRMAQRGKVVRESVLDVPAILGSNLRTAAKIEIAVENGDDPPLGLRAVQIEMRQRKLCFDAPGERVWLYSGAAGAKAPAYDYSRVFRPAARAVVARLGPEEPNPGFVARVERMPFPKRHPGLVWVALAVGVLVVLGGVAWRSGRV